MASNNLLAVVIRNNDITQGKNFVTNNDNEFQLASFSLDKGEVIKRHFHPDQKGLSGILQRFLYLLKEMEIEIYDNDLNLIDEIHLFKNDTIGFLEGHGIKLSTKCRFIEVKQGPFDGSKKRF